MKFASTLTNSTIMLALFGNAFAVPSCYDSGRDIGSDLMRSAAAEACEQEFRGDYDPGQRKSACRNRGVARVQMTVRNGDTVRRRDAPLVSTCIAAFDNIIDYCEFSNLNNLFFCRGGYDIHQSRWEWT
jgi:hypothetical protein